MNTKNKTFRLVIRAILLAIIIVQAMVRGEGSFH